MTDKECQAPRGLMTGSVLGAAGQDLTSMADRIRQLGRWSRAGMPSSMMHTTTTVGFKIMQGRAVLVLSRR